MVRAPLVNALRLLSESVKVSSRPILAVGSRCKPRLTPSRGQELTFGNSGAVFLLLYVVAVAAVAVAGDPSAATAAPCGGYDTGMLTVAFSSWLDEADRKSLCIIGSALNTKIMRGEWTKEYADRVWESFATRYALCDRKSGQVDQNARLRLEEWAFGDPILVVERYCDETWRNRGGLNARTLWVKQELFCEFATNALKPRGFQAFVVGLFNFEDPYAAALQGIARDLCAEVRSGNLTVEDAWFRYAQELRGVSAEEAFGKAAAEILKRSADRLKRDVTGLAKLVVGVVGLIATLFGIYAGLVRLVGSSASKPD